MQFWNRSGVQRQMQISMNSSKNKYKVPASLLAVGYFKHEVICQAVYDTSYLIFYTTDSRPSLYAEVMSKRFDECPMIA